MMRRHVVFGGIDARLFNLGILQARDVTMFIQICNSKRRLAKQVNVNSCVNFFSCGATYLER
jgi:hypothetical protein